MPYANQLIKITTAGKSDFGQVARLVGQALDRAASPRLVRRQLFRAVASLLPPRRCRRQFFAGVTNDPRPFIAIFAACFPLPRIERRRSRLVLWRWRTAMVLLSSKARSMPRLAAARTSSFVTPSFIARRASCFANISVTSAMCIGGGSTGGVESPRLH